MERNETAPKRRRKIKITHILIVLLLTAVFAFALFRLNVRIRFQNRVKAIQAAGLPVTLGEMNELYTIPEGVENAAETFIEAFLCYNELDIEERESLPLLYGRAEHPAHTEPLAQETKDLLAQYIADNKQTLEFLHKAAPIEHCRYPVDYSVALGYPTYHFGDLQNCSRLLNLEAILHAENNEARLAFRSLMTNFGLARSLAKEPTSRSQLIRGVFQEYTASSLERIINRTEFTDEQLLELNKALIEAEDISFIAPGLAGDRCRGIHIFKNPTLLTKEFVGDEALPAPILELYSALGLAERDAIVYLDFINEYIDIADLPLHQHKSASEIVDDKLRKVSRTHILFHMYLPRYSWITRSYLRKIAKIRAARVGIAVQRYRLKTGNLPDALEDLVPIYIDAVPEDPYDGRSLRYDELETGFVVYSIGEDRKDDGGTEKPTGRGNERPSSWDIAFRIEQ